MKSLRYIGLWIILIMIVAVLYDGRREVIESRFVRAFMPYKSIENHNGSVEFRKSRDGHFYIQAQVNKQDVTFLLDTGASDIALTKSDAKRVGIKVNRAEQFRTYETANGSVKAAVVEISKIQIGKFVVKNVPASVILSNGEDMSYSLLGMSFLQHFTFSIKDDVLTLYKN